MDNSTRDRIIVALRKLAAEEGWNPEVYDECYFLVEANLQDELVGFVYDK